MLSLVHHRAAAASPFPPCRLRLLLLLSPSSPPFLLLLLSPSSPLPALSSSSLLLPHRLSFPLPPLLPRRFLSSQFPSRPFPLPPLPFPSLPSSPRGKQVTTMGGRRAAAEVGNLPFPPPFLSLPLPPLVDGSRQGRRQRYLPKLCDLVLALELTTASSLSTNISPAAKHLFWCQMLLY
ncbi:hypothetical protein OPV22_024742 [Ensete ventricosum]|uniref:Uncharacterized protein n=1 Tax=Ensete ventricosum TaxID=4639 RepID=A0AAV8Q1W6_ENSVE|nr:hypothetical protein OPV22_024742 [Ensete ventricosum]